MILALALSLVIQAGWQDARPNMGWTRTGSNAETVMFIKPGPRPNLYWQRHEARQASRTGVLSSMSMVEVDCTGGRSRFLQGSYYPEPNLEGTALHTDSSQTEWRYPAPDTLAATFFDAACDTDD